MVGYKIGMTVVNQSTFLWIHISFINANSFGGGCKLCLACLIQDITCFWHLHSSEKGTVLISQFLGYTHIIQSHACIMKIPCNKWPLGDGFQFTNSPPTSPPLPPFLYKWWPKALIRHKCCLKWMENWLGVCVQSSKKTYIKKPKKFFAQKSRGKWDEKLPPHLIHLYYLYSQTSNLFFDGLV